MTTPGDDFTRAHLVLSKDTIVHHYRIVEKIGAGGMGEVYLAEDSKLNRRVALKFLPEHLAQDSDLRLRFTREAQAAAKLDHPNIVTIHEVSEFQNRPFFAMQYIDGQALNRYCEQRSPSIDQILALVAQAADGLAKAHALGIIHRDIKSANIVVDGDARLKLLDFGLASIQGGDALTKAGSTIGTVAYMSPEQAQGRELDRRSDLFSLGIVLYEMIAGRTPFKRNSDGATLHAIINESPEPLARYKADVSAELQRVMNKILAKNPADRYQSAGDFAADLRTLLRASESTGARTTGRVAKARPSIAVLPFTNMSADPENEYFSDGLTEELLNVLAKNPELKVTGRTSSFAFKGKQEDLRSIGQKLGVETILEGSVRKAGNRVRITTQLVNVLDGFHLWSETFDRVLDDIFAVQDEIAGSVSKAMHVTLVGVNESPKPANPESYALILRAQQSAALMTRESLALGVELYDKAIAIDSENARAWAGLAYAIGHQLAYGHVEYRREFELGRNMYERALAAVEKAAQLDPNLPEVQIALGFVRGALEIRITEAGKAYKRAYELAPNNSLAVTSVALWELLLENYDEALRLARKAVELDPLDPWVRREHARVLTFAGRFDEAREVFARLREMSPDITSLNTFEAGIDLLEGNAEAALIKAKRERVAGYRLFTLAAVYHALGRADDSDRALADLLNEGEQWNFQVACVHAYRGDIDQAFLYLEQSLAVRDAGIPLTKAHPYLRNLHSDPRWLPFLKKIGLSE